MPKILGLSEKLGSFDSFLSGFSNRSSQLRQRRGMDVPCRTEKDALRA